VAITGRPTGDVKAKLAPAAPAPPAPAKAGALAITGRPTGKAVVPAWQDAHRNAVASPPKAAPAPAPAAPADGFSPNMGACADLLHGIREQRLAADKVAAKLKAREDELVEHIIQNLSKKDESGAAGKTHRVQIVPRMVPQVKNWADFYAYIIEHARCDLLQRRVAEKAVEEIWESDGAVPGVEAFRLLKLSLTKI
jgi:hypothetical protein